MNLLLFLVFFQIDFRVTEITIQGNEYFNDKAIKNVMLTRTRALFRKGKFDHNVYKGDIAAIKNLYDYNGFLETEIRDSLTFDSTKKTVKINIDIKEGNQTIIKEIEFTGNTLFSDEFLKEKIITKLEKPFDRRKFEIDNHIITSIYDDIGYTEVKINTQYFFNNYQAKISYNIAEGEKQFIEDIEITGLRRTRKDVVSKELVLKQQDILRYAQVLKSRRNLTNLGIFSSIRTQTISGSQSDHKIIQFIFSEKDPIALNFRVGYGTRDYLRFGAGITHLNMLGRAWQGKLEGKISFSEYRLNSEITFPRFLILPLRYRIGSFYQFKREIGFNTRHIGFYNEFRFDLLTGSFSTKYNVENIRTYFPIKNSNQNGDSTKNEWLHGITLNWLRDRRDDPISTNAGNYTNLSLETSGIIMPADVNYVRPTMEFRFFKPFIPVVLGIAFKTGVIQPIAPSSDIPVYKRFYCGGTTSVRGYADWSIGPKDSNGNPIGGRVLFETSAEFRFPVYKILGGVLFVNAGNVWRNIDDIDGKLKWAIGLGMRLRTPLGSIRLDYGMKIKPELNESSGTLHFAIGEAF
ncbi:MAG: outer membrane protein assembly factor BamA [candidate division WOR-3 bacterium]